MGFVPKHWGPHVWSTIHILAMGAPEHIPDDTKIYYAQFFNNLPHLLPCAVCGEHLAQNLETMPVEPHLQGRESLFAWTVDLHNVVNKQTGKADVSYDDAFNHWKRVCLGDDKECTAPKQFYVYICGSLIVFCLVVYYLMFSRSRVGRR